MMCAKPQSASRDFFFLACLCARLRLYSPGFVSVPEVGAGAHVQPTYLDGRHVAGGDTG